jgi:hypothetical protein
MPANPVKSAIREVRDQLLLDRAGGRYLSNISTNLNFERPQFGFADDAIWRALVRRAALDYRQIQGLFRDYLKIIFGPQKTVYTVLKAGVDPADITLMVMDPERLPQRGTLYLDQGTTTQETLDYVFCDPRDGTITLNLQANKTHLARLTANVSGEMKFDSAISATTLSLFDSKSFPTDNFPYTLIVDPGTASEEVTTLTGHNPALNQLTVSPALTKAHKGPLPTPVVSHITRIEAGKTVIRLNSSELFPASGTIRLLKNDGLTTTSEIAVYTDNDVATGTLFLKQALANTYPIVSPWTTVTLMTEGTTVALAQVQVKGVGWDLFVTQPDELTIYIPREQVLNRMQDASWLHVDGAITASTTIATGHATAIGDTQIKVTLGGLASFPSGGLITVNPGLSQEVIGFARHDSNTYTRLVPSVAGVNQIPSGSTVLHVECARLLAEFDWYNKFKKLYLARNNPGSEEVVTYTTIDTEKNTVTLAAGTVNNHSGQDLVHLFDWPDILYLDRPLEVTHAAGQTIQYTRPIHAGTTVHDGRIFTSVDDLYQGPYTVDFGAHIPRTIQTTLAENIAAPTQLVCSVLPGVMSLEVLDASSFNNAGEFNVEIKGGGYIEEIDTDDVVLQASVSGVLVDDFAAAGSSSLTFSGGGLPMPAAPPYGYRLLIGADSFGAAEIVSVSSISGSVISLMGSTVNDHGAGATLSLLADVIVLADPVGYEYQGKVPKLQRTTLVPGPLTPYAQGAWVREIRTYVKVAGIADFTAGKDQILINFGYSDQELVEYNGVATTPSNRLLFPDGIKFTLGHASGDPVHLNGTHNKTVGDGTDHVFYLPASMEDRLKYIFDRGRAAGVKITVIDSK